LRHASAPRDAENDGRDGAPSRVCDLLGAARRPRCAFHACREMPMMAKIEADRRRAGRRRDVTADPRRSRPAGGFAARDVVPLAGMGSYDTLDYWATRGILTPSLAAASGTGSQRRYSFADVVAARMAISLRAQGLGFQSVRRIIS